MLLPLALAATLLAAAPAAAPATDTVDRAAPPAEEGDRPGSGAMSENPSTDAPPSPRTGGEEASSKDAPPDPDRVLTEAEARDLAYDASVLASGSVDEQVRVVAAQRLLDLRAREAWRILADRLRPGTGPATDAVVAALEASGGSSELPDLLRDAAIDALGPAADPLRERLAALLMRQRERTVPRAAAAAADPSRTIEARVAATDILSVVATPEAVDALLDLAGPARATDDAGRAVAAAAFAGLRRLSPVDHATDHAAWTTWWERTRSRPAEDWWLSLRERDRRVIADLRARNARLAERHTEALRDLYLGLPLDQQLERLPRDLADELDHVRLFAAGRIERLLRDSVPLPDAIRAALVERLADDAPRARAASARLLHQMNEPTLASRLVPVLARETDTAAATAYLDVFASRTVPEALDPILARLPRRPLTDLAARALWTLLRDHPLEPAGLARVADLVREAARDRATPPVLRVLALCGSDEDLLELEGRMSLADATEAPELAAAVAEGFLARGRTDRLLAHADVPAVLPLAIRGLARGPADAASLRRLLELPVGDRERAAWLDAVRTIAMRIPPAELLPADRLLAGNPALGPEVRRDMLVAAAMLPPDQLPAADRGEVLVRVVPLLQQSGELLRAHELLALAGDAASIPAVQNLAFRIAILVGRHDDAARVTVDPGRWIGVLDGLVVDDPPAARRLATEIARRFPGLNGDLRARLDGLVAMLGRDPDDVGNPNGAAPEG